MANDISSDTLLIAGRYELHEILGRGSMGTVYQGRDVVLDRPVAVKLLPTDATDAAQAARFEQEAKLLARLSHPGLVVVFDAGIDAAVTDDPKPYLVMELVPGRTLADRLRSGPLPSAEVATLAAQLASALNYIHRRDIVHRDLKPANILLAASDDPRDGETAKLTDFGIARLVDGARMTMTGHTLGTANYVSPEQLQGERVGPPSDVYSLGLVLLECLTGEVAYPGIGAEAALARLSRQPTIPDSVPDGWARLLATMTHRDPGARPGAAEVGVAVTGLAEAPVPDSTATAVLRAPAPVVDDVAPAPVEPATQVLPITDLPGVVDAGDDRRLPRLRNPAAVALAAAVVLLFVLGFALAATDGGGTPRPNPATSPSYPSVPGPLGTHLRQLQRDVAP
jgi:serine/threonine protein kinase